MANKQANRKKAILIGSSVLVIAVILYFVGFYPWPASDNLSGTIGGVEKVKKYQTEQISSDDVVLQNTEIQALLQNDKVQKLIKSDDFKKIISDDAFRTALEDPAFRSAITGTEFHTALNNDAYSIE